MKDCIYAVFIVLACPSVPSVLCADSHPAAKMTIRVVDESGAAISNATAVVVFERQKPAGEGAGTDQVEVQGRTDGDGVYAAEGRGNQHVRCTAWGDGYYRTYAGLYSFTNCISGRWEPWNPLLEIPLRAIVNPVPMYAKKVETLIPATNQWHGFDLVAGDWVAPMGAGKSTDLRFRVEGYWAGPIDNCAVLGMQFVTDRDGLIPVSVTNRYGSALRLPREAPASGYESQRDWRKTRQKDADGKDRLVSDYAEDVNYFFRVRTQLGVDGEVTNALYGKIRGDIKFGGASEKGSYLKFTYYLNPTPNDRNLEFDPARNLFTNLSSLEQVRDP